MKRGKKELTAQRIEPQLVPSSSKKEKKGAMEREGVKKNKTRVKKDRSHVPNVCGPWGGVERKERSGIDTKKE